jgi:hypothetical protein
VADPNHSSKAYAVDVALEFEAEITSVDFDGNDTVTFDGYGKPDNGGTVVLGGRVESRKISVDPDSGKASSS